MKITYAATLAFSPDLRKVALIQKSRPAWLAGKWTVIGGHVEEGETPVGAAVRELGEEAGLWVGYDKMVPFARIEWQRGGACQVFAIICPEIWAAQTKTDERVMVWNVSTLPAYHNDLSDDLCALVEMAKMALRHPESRTFAVLQMGRR